MSSAVALVVMKKMLAELEKIRAELQELKRVQKVIAEDYCEVITT